MQLILEKSRTEHKGENTMTMPGQAPQPMLAPSDTITLRDHTAALVAQTNAMKALTVELKRFNDGAQLGGTLRTAIDEFDRAAGALGNALSQPR